MAPRNGSGILEPISARNELDRLMVHIESTLLFVMVLLVVGILTVFLCVVSCADSLIIHLVRCEDS